MEKYTIKIKYANSWHSVTQNGIIADQIYYPVPLIEFYSKDDTIDYINNLFVSAHKYAKCVTNVNNNSKRIIYGYITDICKNNSVLMALINSKLNTDHTILTTNNIYSAPGVRILIVRKTEHGVG
jgi:hypothetical protein